MPIIPQQLKKEKKKPRKDLDIRAIPIPSGEPLGPMRGLCTTHGEKTFHKALSS